MKGRKYGKSYIYDLNDLRMAIMIATDLSNFLSAKMYKFEAVRSYDIDFRNTIANQRADPLTNGPYSGISKTQNTKICTL